MAEFDWDEECSDIDWLDPGEDFMQDFKEPVVLHKDIVRSVRNEEVVVLDQVVDVLSEAPEEIISVIGANEIVRVPSVEKKWYSIDVNGVLNLEGGAFIDGEKSKLVWAKKNNRTLFRDLIFDNYIKYLEIAQDSDCEEALSWYRMLRSVTPVLNIITKKVDVMNSGLSTLAKIRDMLEYCFELGAPKSVVAFGVAGCHHAMCYHPDIRLCVDTNSRNYYDNDYFVEGSIFDWKNFVKEGDMILSDCSILNDEASGMLVPDDMYDIYEEMVKSGYYILVKINKLGIPYIKNWLVSSICYYREHNLEAFIIVSPEGFQNVYEMRSFDIEDRMMLANDSRMRKILSRDVDSLPVTFCYTERELEKAIKLVDFTFREGEKNFSVINDVFHKFTDTLNRDWKYLCYDEKYVKMEFTEYLEITVEMPCVLIDVQFMAADKDRLFASFHHYCFMEFYQEIGWVAVDMKPP